MYLLCLGFTVQKHAFKNIVQIFVIFTSSHRRSMTRTKNLVKTAVLSNPGIFVTRQDQFILVHDWNFWFYEPVHCPLSGSLKHTLISISSRWSSGSFIFWSLALYFGFTTNIKQVCSSHIHKHNVIHTTRPTGLILTC